MSKKNRYTLYVVEGRPKRRWKRVVLWASIALVVVAVALAGGSYLWFRAQVSSANGRVSQDIRQALQEKPSTTLTTLADAESAAVASGPTSTVDEPSPSAMNLLVIGSDRRSNDPSIGGRSDTLMVVHVDPELNYLSVLSLPRDLRVDIPGHGKGKLNTAFAYGGAPLAIKTIEQTTGVDINHYLEVGFTAFADMVDSLGGVYVDVDRRYYNPDYYYEPIDLYPGFQLLKGSDALDFVRFRHDRNMDFGRMERQQRFMNALREQAMGWNLPFKLPGLISALFKNVATDLDANEILRLARWGVGLNGDDIRGITLRGSIPTINGAAYVVVSEDKLARAVSQFLHESVPDDPADATVDSTTGGDTTVGSDGSTGDTLGAYSGYATSSTTSTTLAADLQGLTVDVTGVSGRSGEAAAAATWLGSLGVTIGSSADGSEVQQHSSIAYPPSKQADAKKLAAATGISQTTRNSRLAHVTLFVGKDFILPQAFAVSGTSGAGITDAWVWQPFAAQTPFAVEAPAYLPDGYVWTRRFPDTYATYNIEPGGTDKPAFRMMYGAKINFDQVFGITETTWLDAPAASKGLEVTHDGVVYTVVRNDTKVERVWWKSDGVLYFVSNTLSYWLDQEEMLKIAESMVTVPKQ